MEGSHSGLVRAPAKRLGGEIPLTGSNPVPSAVFNVLRGLHGDIKSWKLVTCVFGEVFQVVVDTRPESKNYLKWKSVYDINQTISETINWYKGN